MKQWTFPSPSAQYGCNPPRPHYMMVVQTVLQGELIAKETLTLEQIQQILARASGAGVCRIWRMQCMGHIGC